MKSRILLCILALAPMLGGCGIYSNYSRPESIQADSLYRAEVLPPTQQDSSSLAQLSWRELFTDPYLVKLIEKGLEQNTDLLTAQLRVEEAKASLTASKLAFFPSLNFNPQGTVSSFDGAAATKTYSLDFAASWEIDAFGSLRNSMKGTAATYQAQLAYEQAVRTQLIATIADNYYSLVAADKSVELTRATVESWEDCVKTMEALKRSGDQNEAAVAQTRASLLEAQAQLLSYEQQVFELENTLSTLLGEAPGKIERSSLFELEFPGELSVGVSAELLSKRPDVRQAEWTLANAFYATNSARSAFYPKITLSGTAGWTNSSGSAIVDPGKWLLSAVGSIVQPLFNNGSNIANLKIAKAQQEEAVLAFSQTLLDAGSEVNNALKQWQTSRATMEYDAQRVELLEQVVKSTTLLMQYGTTNYLEVITARQTLLAAQLAEVNDKYSEIQSVITLYHALGGGED